jgi:azurin
MKVLFTIILTAFLLSNTHAVTKVTISGNDQMQFSLKEFEVKAGDDVELEFKNAGSLPKIAMGHNLVILKEGVSAIAFGGKALQAGANATNALPDAVKDDVLAFTKLLGPGEVEVIKFKAPAKPGIHQFVCTFPGHYAMMRGVMVVK